MADIVTFDPVNLRIVEIDAAGDNELDAVEIYSEWKDWLLSDGANMGYPPAFRVVGGDPTSATQSLGITYFLQNGWKIRPAESDHKFTIVGNMRSDPATESVFVAALGAFTVHTETQFANLVSTIGVAEDVVNSMFARVMEGQISFDQMMRIIAAAVAGKVTGGPNAPVFRNLSDTKDQVTGEADSSGNRTSASYGT